MRPSRIFLAFLCLSCACSRAKTSATDTAGTSSPTVAASAAPPAQGAASPVAAAKPARAGGGGPGGLEEKKKEGGNEAGKADDGPKTWKRAGAATHAARVSIGDKEQLPIRGMQMKVDIDGFRARVVIDAYFENDRDRQYEGTFQLRLPADATPYFYAFGETEWQREEPTFKNAAFFGGEAQRKMGTTPELIMAARAKTWRAPKEARIVPKEKAAFAFTETTRAQLDPALLEWAGAGVFNGRLFPIAPKRIHRVVLGYDVNLVRAGNDFEYALDVPEGIKNVSIDVTSNSVPVVEPTLVGTKDGARVFFHTDDPKDHTLTFRFAKQGNPLLVGDDAALGKRFAANVVAELPAQEAATQPRAVFLVDTSLSANPDRFNVFLKLLAAVLTNNRPGGALKQFNVLFFDVQTSWWKNAWVDNTPENVAALVAAANNLSLEGATDIGAALAAAAMPEWVGGETGGWDTFLLSDGAATWGESDKNVMESAFARAHRGPVFAYDTGLAGTDGAALAHLARETGGAYFSVVGEEEIKRASTAHRARPYHLVSVTAADGDDVIVAGRPRSVYPGQALLVAGRGAPKDITITVEQGGKELTIKPALAPALTSPLASRAYGQVATFALEELGKVTEPLAKSYAVHHRIAGETCSLVMLESEADYRRFNIVPENEAKVVAESPALAAITKAEVALEGSLSDPKAYVQRWLESLKDKPGVDVKLSTDLFAAVAAMPRESFIVMPRPLTAKARTKDTLPSDLRERLTMPGQLEYESLTREAMVRREKYGAGDALRALSSLVEQSPGDGILARDVGFTAMELELPDQGFFLFRRVADARPWEPQSYRAMADVLARMGKADLAMVYYEVALQGTWQPRFGEFHRIVSVDYAHFLRRVARGDLKISVPEFASRRFDAVAKEADLAGADLVVMITWNTDNSDVDLHVTEPSGEECFYQNRKTKLGGQLTQDVTQGYGPEMYVMKKAKSGTYKVNAHYFAQQRNRASARTKVYAEVIENWGTPSERITEKVVTLAEGKDNHSVLDVDIKR